MIPTFKLAAAAGALATVLAAPAWSQPTTTAAPQATQPSANSVMSGTTTTSKDRYDPSNTQLRAQCYDAATGNWRNTPACESLKRIGTPPGVVEGGTPATAAGAANATSSLNAGTTGSTSSLNSNAGMSGSTTRSTTGGASH